MILMMNNWIFVNESSVSFKTKLMRVCVAGVRLRLARAASVQVATAQRSA